MAVARILSRSQSINVSGQRDDRNIPEGRAGKQSRRNQTDIHDEKSLEALATTRSNEWKTEEVLSSDGKLD